MNGVWDKSMILAEPVVTLEYCLNDRSGSVQRAGCD